MKPKERAFIYCILAVTLAVNFIHLSSAIDSPVTAAPVVADESLETDEIRLSGESEVVLRNRDGRLSWRDDATASAHSLAFVHVGKVLSGMMNTDSFIEEREQLEDELREIGEDLSARFETFRERFENVTPESPEFEEGSRQYRALMDERQQLESTASRRRGSLAGSQVERAYRDILAAVEVVSERRKIDLVYRFVPPDREFNAKTVQEAYLNIRARTVLSFPEALDITNDVVEELDLEIE